MLNNDLIENFQQLMAKRKFHRKCCIIIIIFIRLIYNEN
ncbi:hypothetical protein NT01EI_0656 [Edwardsiella ictaluri 93-146]|uniref:Uncharacterized protein n=1 Tax=Edwardsiella ictaluri (strain 93-146) TaxID=634503 RepID=C5B7K2_EDWI9|nr:hypothetical protein NT01EI_0656 [Edwardsiella ictaluri 93-146]